MTAAGLTLVTYVWHYLVARLMYDQLLRPLLHGHFEAMLPFLAVAAAGFLIGWWSGRRRSEGPRRSSSRRRA